MKKIELKIPNEKFDKFDLSNIFNVYSDQDDNTYYNLCKTINFTKTENIPETKFSYYTVKSNDTWPLISWKSYGTTKLWWLICKVNNINDSFEEPQSGSKIKILNNELVNYILDYMKNN